MTERSTMSMSFKIFVEDAEFFREHKDKMMVWMHELRESKQETGVDWKNTSYYTDEEFEAKRREIRSRGDID